MSDHAQVSRAAISILGTRVGIYPFKIIIGLTVASILGAAEYGIYSFLVLPGAVLLPLMTFGIGIGVRYYISSEEYGAKDVSFTSLLLGMLNGLITALFFGLLWKYNLLGETGRAIPIELLLPVLLVLPVQGAAMFMNRVILGASWFSAMNLYIFLINLGPPVFLLAFVVVGGQGLTGAIAAIVWANAVLALVSTVMVFVRYRPRIRIDFGFLQKTSRYGIKAWVGALANQANVRFDQFVLGFVQAPEALGVYRIAVMIAELLWLIPDAVNIPLFNRVSKTEGLTERLKVITQSHRVLILVVSTLGLGMLVTGWWAVPWILGSEYTDARWLLAILIPGAAALVTARTLGMFFSASGKPEKASAIALVGAAASVASYLSLIPWLGVAGAAIGTTLSYFIIAVASRFMFVREARPHPVRLYRATTDDLHWARALVLDSFSIWRGKIRRVE